MFTLTLITTPTPSLMLLKSEDKYLKDEDRKSSRDRESSRDRDKDSDSDSDASKDLDKDSVSDSSDADVFSKMPKTNSIKIRCEECNEELTQKNYGRHIQSLKHKKN